LVAATVWPLSSISWLRTSAAVCIESHAISVRAPECAVLRLPLLVAPLPFRHPSAGPLTLHSTSLLMADDPMIRIVIRYPATVAAR
jgi:hypothetical protein